MASSLNAITRTIRLVALAMLLCQPAGSAFGQNSGDGSIYSRLGIGELRSNTSSQVVAMGGGGLGLQSLNYVNFLNPASFADQVLTRVSAGVVLQRLDASDAQDNLSRLAEGTLGPVQFSFPIASRKMGVGLSFAPISRMSYRVQSEAWFRPDPAEPDTAMYITDFEGGGGLQEITAGFGYRLNQDLSLGASAGFVFGILEQSRRTSFPGSGYFDSPVSNSTRITGFRGSLGLLYDRTGLLGEADVVSIGATIGSPAFLSASRIRTLGDGFDRDTLAAGLEGDITLPFSGALGVAYAPSEHWTLLADARYEPWSSFESDLPLSGYDPAGASAFKDRVRVSGGLEFIPAGNDLISSFFARTAYRLGAYFDQAYVAPSPDVSLNSIALTGGFSLPTLFPGTRLDINLEVGSRGTTDNNLVRDVFYRVSANINIGERWFQQQKLR